MLNENSIADFKRNLRGPLIGPGDADYDEARKVYNGMIHKKPRLIARCSDVGDVIRSVNFARNNDLLVSIRGGGHNAGGLGICDDGLVIDLAPIKYTRVDPAARTVTAGGGNFGVVTSFTFRLHPIDTLYAGPMLYELSETADVMKWYRDLIPSAPDDLNGFFAFLTVPPAPPFPEHLHMNKMCGVVWAYAGPQKKAEETFAPIRAFKQPALDFVGPLPHPALQSMFDALYPPGLQWYWRADFVNEINDDAIAQYTRFGEALPTMHSTMHMYPIDGAAARVGKSDTAWNYRDSNWAQVIVGVDPDPTNKEKIVSWTKSYYDAVHPYSAGGAYVNFLMGDEGEERVKKTYGGNYDRLVAIKKKYDPDNFFRVNQNVKPS